MDKILFDTLENLHDKYNKLSFIETDPIQIPHRFKKREDIEIAAFLTSLIAWGNRKSIIKNASDLLKRMDNTPHSFITTCSASDLRRIDGFVHRTFNAQDCMFVIRSLKNLYCHHGGLKEIFEKQYDISKSIPATLSHFRNLFFETKHLARSRKHISDIEKNSAAKRLNLFLMWMCRKDNRGVHFGLWNIPSSALFIPLDVHCARIGRSLDLLKRKQNDWKAVEKLTASLRMYDPADPVKYDFALFGLGVSGEQI